MGLGWELRAPTEGSRNGFQLATMWVEAIGKGRHTRDLACPARGQISWQPSSWRIRRDLGSPGEGVFEEAALGVQFIWNRFISGRGR